MRRSELEHIIRAAADIADDDEIVVIGSQSVLGQFPEAPEELCVSNEADVYPKNRPERWDVIDGSIGGAHREKDLRFNRAAIRHGLVNRDTLVARLATTTVDEARRKQAEQSLLADFQALPNGGSD